MVDFKEEWLIVLRLRELLRIGKVFIDFCYVEVIGVFSRSGLNGVMGVEVRM